MVSIFGAIQETDYRVKIRGITSTFDKGTVYRHPGRLPMADLAGSHYEMGLQYGVLLKPDLLNALGSYEKIINLKATELGLDVQTLLMGAKVQAAKIAQKIPKRFLEELQGMSDGCGIPFETILTLSLIYDIGQAMEGCTSILLRQENGSLIHGRHNDSATFLGDELPNLAVIVRYRPDQYYSLIQLDILFWTGIETGYNDQGITYSEETLRPRAINKEGGSVLYFARDALERSACLDEVEEVLKESPLIGGYGMVWGDAKNNTGTLLEVAGTHYQKIPWNKSILCNFNKYYSKELHSQEAPTRLLTGYVPDREELAALYSQKEFYTVEDAINFLQMTKNEKGQDYAWMGSKTSICNKHTQQTVIFTPSMKGFYYALASSFAGCSDFYFYSEDFSQPPVLMLEKAAINPIAAEEALIENQLISLEDKLVKRINLAAKYPGDANMQFVVAMGSFQLKKTEQFRLYANAAFELSPETAEYALYAGIAALFNKEYAKAMQILSGIDKQELTPEQNLLKLTVQKISLQQQGIDAKDIADLIVEIINEFGVQSYYNSTLLPPLHFSML